MSIWEIVIQSVSDIVSPWLSCEFTTSLAKLQGWSIILCSCWVMTRAVFSNESGTMFGTSVVAAIVSGLGFAGYVLVTKDQWQDKHNMWHNFALCSECLVIVVLGCAAIVGFGSIELTFQEKQTTLKPVT
jgi:hypothetical protein